MGPPMSRYIQAKKLYTKAKIDENTTPLQLTIYLYEGAILHIRKAIQQGKDVRHFLPRQTYEYLEEMNFYKK